MDEPKKNAYLTAWMKENTRRVSIRFNLKSESEMVEWIENIPNKQSYIKSLIKADMEKHKK